MKISFAFPRLSWGISALLGTGLLLLAGCGKNGTATVTGTVTYNNKPLPGGFITFVAAEGSRVARGKIEKDGSYRVEKAPVGNVKIGIQALEPPKFGYGAGASSKEEAAKMSKKPVAVNPADSPAIPKKFTDPNKSGLTYTVKPGPQEYNITLK